MKTSTNDDIFKIRTRYGISEKARVLVTASVLSRGKNIDILIKCLPKIRMKDVILLVAGESSTKADFHYKDDLKKLVKTLGLGKQVIFTGWLQQEDLWLMFRSSDLFVLPSKSEGMPNVMLEAMGCDIPCIGSDIPGIRDIFQYEELMFDPSDETALADKIGQILSNHQFLDKVKRLCQERKEVFAFNWKERAFQTVTMGFNHVCERP
jgi:glycosyltransferase involved in cell wall biosynthesis